MFDMQCHSCNLLTDFTHALSLIYADMCTIYFCDPCKPEHTQMNYCNNPLSSSVIIFLFAEDKDILLIRNSNHLQKPSTYCSSAGSLSCCFSQNCTHDLSAMAC